MENDSFLIKSKFSLWSWHDCETLVKKKKIHRIKILLKKWQNRHFYVGDSSDSTVTSTCIFIILISITYIVSLTNNIFRLQINIYFDTKILIIAVKSQNPQTTIASIHEYM